MATKPRVMNQPLMPNVVCEISYRCRRIDLEEPREEGTIEGFWTGEVDTWGKHTIRPVDGGAPLYLFKDEIVDVN